jgi:hypothetical protein
MAVLQSPRFLLSCAELDLRRLRQKLVDRGLPGREDRRQELASLFGHLVAMGMGNLGQDPVRP